MSTSKSVFLFFLLLFGCPAIVLLSGVLEESPTVSAPAEPTEIRQKMEQAYSNGATLFQYKRDVKGMALCNGNQWIVDLGANIKEVELTAHETTNLTLCKYDSETQAYYIMQEIDWTNPGDYLVWESSGLCGLRYK